ncbi:MAG: hypothetical protein IIA62_05750 [Nitrospinae bacterium]|nr:hypothetical protein [Nitrospinota bacterium]
MIKDQHGKVDIKIEGKARMVFFDWDGLDRLRAEVGPDFDEKIAKAGYEFNTDVLAIALSAGLKYYWPEVTPGDRQGGLASNHRGHQDPGACPSSGVLWRQRGKVSAFSRT